MSLRGSRFAPLYLLLAATSCVRPLQFPTEVAGAGSQSTQVVIVSAAGKLTTSTPSGGTRIPATPTFDPGFGSILTPLAGTPLSDTATPTSGSPTPELRPTRTPAPSVTPFPTIEIPPTPDRSQTFENPATRTPRAPTATRRPQATRPPSVTPTATLVDPNGSIGDLASAKPIASGQDVTGLMTGMNAINVFAFDVVNEEDQIVVTLTGQDIDHYRLYLISPGRQQSAFGQLLGASGRVIRYPARGETGTWFVEVTTDGLRVPIGNYTLRVDTTGVTPTRVVVAATRIPTLTPKA
jgi:hypothetical protein